MATTVNNEMIGKKVLIRQQVKVMKGDQVVSVKVIYEKPKEVAAPAPAPAPAAPEKPKIITTTDLRPSFMEPLSPKSQSNFQKEFDEEMKRSQKHYYEWEMRQPSTYIREIEGLEREREKFNRKRAWTAMDLLEVEQIDKKIKECEQTLYELEEEEDWYDEDSE